MAAQIAALARGDIAGFLAIGSAMKEDAEKARTAFDAWEQKMLAAGAAAKQTAKDAGEASAGLTKAQQDALKAFADAEAMKKAAAEAKKLTEEFDKLRAKLEGKEIGVEAGFIKTLQLIDSEGKKAGMSTAEIVRLQELFIKQQPYMIEQEKQAVKLAEDRQKLRQQEADSIAAFQREEEARQATAVKGARDALQAATDELANRGRLKSEIELTTIARLSEQLVTKTAGSEAHAALVEEIRLRTLLMGKLKDIELAEANSTAAKAAQEQWKQVSDAFVDNLMRGGKSVAQYLKDLFRTLVLKPILQPVGNMFSQVVNSFVQPVVNGISQYMGMGTNAMSGGSMFAGVSNMAAPGGAYYNFATSGMGQTFGLSNAPSASFMGPPTQATSLTGGGGMGSMAYGAGAAATIAVIAMAAAEAWQSTRGEQRGGARFDWAPGTGATFTSGPDGSRADGADDIVKTLLGATSASLNDAFKAFGSSMTVAALTGAWETSANGRGGVFSGGRLSDGSLFGENGSGSNYQFTGPLDSKYELWGAEAGKFGMSGSFDTNGDPSKLATDLQQSYIAAIQASAGIIPRIVEETYQREIASNGAGFTPGASGYEGSPDNSALTTDATTTRWLRVFDVEMEQRARELGLLPKKILDLIAGVDPETLSAEATAALTGKISALVANVSAFRVAVDEMPVAELRDVTFDTAAGIVEMVG
ncbi:MAG TPA: hypothetical protein VLJ58_04265, partial [Ramlibacter sp.]|nr:hypothetical protein [Ramlibacter sp.]